MSDTITISDEVMQAAREWLRTEVLYNTRWLDTLPKDLDPKERKIIAGRLADSAYNHYIAAQTLLRQLVPDKGTRNYVLAKAAQEAKP